MMRKLQADRGAAMVALLASVALLVVGQGCAKPAASAPFSVSGYASSSGVTNDPVWPRITSAPAASLPAATMAVTTLNRWGLTTMAALTPDGGLVPLSESHAMDDTQVAFASDTLAHLVLRGPDPASNFVEVIDVERGQSWQVTPAPGYAIFGFALAPDGARLAYLEVDLRGTRRPVPWQVVLVDLSLRSGQAPRDEAPQAMAVSAVQGQALVADRRQVVLHSDVASPVAQMPFAWSAATGELILKGIIPYQAGGGRGVWTVQPDGSHLRQVLLEAEYVGQPRLSYDGTRLAFLAGNPVSSPRNQPFHAGAPAANALYVLNLLTDQAQLVARSENGTFGDLAWSQDDTTVLVSHGEWAAGPMQFREIIAFAEDGGQREVIRLETEQPGSITALRACGSGVLFAVRSANGAVLWRTQGEGETARLLELPEGELGIVDCLRAKRGG